MMTRKILNIVIVYSIALMAGAGLLHIAQKVQDTEDRLASLRQSILDEKDNIRSLKAEWAFLNAPERLEYLAVNHLNMVPADTGQVFQEAQVLRPLQPDEGDEMLEDDILFFSNLVDGPLPLLEEFADVEEPVLPARKSEGRKPAQGDTAQDNDFNRLLAAIPKQSVSGEKPQ